MLTDSSYENAVIHKLASMKTILITGSLGTWVNNMRRRREGLSERQVQALEEAGFVWNYANEGKLSMRQLATMMGVTKSAIMSWEKDGTIQGERRGKRLYYSHEHGACHASGGRVAGRLWRLEQLQGRLRWNRSRD